MNMAAAVLLAFDIMSGGTQIEHFVVPAIDCAGATICTALQYEINYDIGSCMFPAAAKVTHAGRRIPIAIEETGTRGHAGYRWTLRTTEIFHGETDVEVSFINQCESQA